MLIADDYFTFMSSASLVLAVDSSLYCVTATNLNGQSPFINDSGIFLNLNSSARTSSTN